MGRTRLVAAVAAVALAALAASAAAPAANTRLVATVGPGFDIRLADESGQLVRRLDPGTYDITVRDLSDEHNFHLFGPGVNETTAVVGTGTVTWTVTFREGRYNYVCDPHSDGMRGAFVVGDPPPDPQPPPVPPPPPPAAPKLVGVVGPGATIVLRNSAGSAVRSLKAGAYAITVRDRTKAHNFHLVGVGVNRRTTIAGTGTFTWRVTLRRGKLTIYSDAAPRTLRRALEVR